MRVGMRTRSNGQSCWSCDEEDPELEYLGALQLELDDEGKQDEVDDLKQNDEVESESWGEDEEQSIMGT